MPVEALRQSLGRLEGKVDALTASVDRYSTTHAREHELLNEHVHEMKADLNKVKGAKWAVFAVAGFASGLVTAAKDLFHR